MADEDEVPQRSSEKKPAGFNEITKRYKSNPTIENYVGLRRGSPNQEIQVATTGGLDFLFSHDRLIREIGIEPRVFAQALDADEQAQSDIALFLLEKLIERKNIINRGGSQVVSRGNAIGDALVNYLIGCMLDALDWTDDLTISRDLIVLIKFQLGAVDSEYVASTKMRERRQNARFIAVQIRDGGKTPTYRGIAKIMGVQPSTVKRWFPAGDLIEEAEKLSGIGKLMEEMQASAKRSRIRKKILELLTERSRGGR
jgi:hypothetical protein